MGFCVKKGEKNVACDSPRKTYVNRLRVETSVCGGVRAESKKRNRPCVADGGGGTHDVLDYRETIRYCLCSLSVMMLGGVQNEV